MKKIISLILVFSVILTCFSSAIALAADEATPKIVYSQSETGDESYSVTAESLITKAELIINKKNYSLPINTTDINITPYLKDADDNFINDTAKINIKTQFGNYTLKICPLFGGGNGTNVDPYLIFNERHFSNISKFSASSFLQMKELLISEPCSSFSGYYDGNNLKTTLVLVKDTEENVGLFSTLSGSFKIKNVITVGTVSGIKNVGAIAGYICDDASGESIIESCTNYAEVNSKSGSCGGIAGFFNNSTAAANTNLRNLVNYGSISSESGSYTGGIAGLITGTVKYSRNEGKVSGNNYTGGICGILYGKMENCSNHGVVYTNKDSVYIAGLAGSSRSQNCEIKNCYNTGDITGTDSAYASGITNAYTGSNGGLNINCCYNSGKAKYPLYYNNPNVSQNFINVYRSYYLNTTGTQDGQGTSLTHEQMKVLDNFSGFLTSIWKIDDSFDYPQLRNSLSDNILSYNLLPASPSGSPLTICKSLDCAVLELNGRNLFFTSSQGTPAIFNVLDLDTKTIIGSFPMTGTKSPWKHLITPDNMVYVVADRILFRYNPYTNEFTSLGYYESSQTASFGMCCDPEGNVYIGTYPDAKIIKYNPDDNTFTDLGTIDPELFYARSLLYKNGYLYIIAYGNQMSRFIRFNPDNPKDVTRYELESCEGYFDAKDIYWAYTVTEADSLILIFSYFSGGGPYLITFDTDTDSFIDVGFRDRFKGMYATPVKDHKTYLISGGGQMYELDTIAKKTTKLDFSAGITDEFNGGGWVKLKGYPDFPGETLVTVNNDTGYPIFINLSTKQRMEWEDIYFEGGAITIHNMENGPKGEMYFGGYMGNRVSIYTPETKEFRRIPMGQTEGMVEYNDKMYFGIYTGAVLHEYDPSQPDSSTNPKRLDAAPGDRPFAMEPVGNRIYMGMIPSYGHLDGNLAYYDFDTQKMTALGNIIPNQSIMSLKYHDGYLYGSTTIFGGNSIDPTEKEAKIFKYDIVNETVVDSFTPELEDVDIKHWIGSISFDKDGKMWAVSGYTLFSVDFENKKVTNQINFGNYTWEGTVWKPVKIRYDKDGILFANVNGLKAVNTSTGEWSDLSNLTIGTPSVYDFDDYGNFYYAEGDDGVLEIMYRSEYKIEKDDIDNAKNYFRDKIGMKIETPYMIKNGELTTIDPENINTTPFISNDVTYLPLRATAESLGAHVVYHEDTQSVTIHSDEVNIIVNMNSPRVRINGQLMLLNNSPILKEGRLYLPLREISNLFSRQLDWSDSGVIIISEETISLQNDFRNVIDAYFNHYIKNDYENSLD